MNPIASHITFFLQQRLPVERRASFGLAGIYGLRMLVTIVLSTWIGLAVTAWVLRGLLRPAAA